MSSGNDFISPWKRDGVQFWSIDYIQAPRGTVFAYLTRAEHTQHYYFGMPINDPAAAGDPLWYGTNRQDAAIFGQVTAFDAPARFAHTFQFAGRDEPVSHVEFTLFDHGPDLTGLVTCHHGFAGRDSATYNDIAGGWPMILSGLKTLIETGKPLTWPPPATGEAGHD